MKTDNIREFSRVCLKLIEDLTMKSRGRIASNLVLHYTGESELFPMTEKELRVFQALLAVFGVARE